MRAYDHDSHLLIMGFDGTTVSYLECKAQLSQEEMQVIQHHMLDRESLISDMLGDRGIQSFNYTM